MSDDLEKYRKEARESYKKEKEYGGVWRTVLGRRVFIKDDQSLDDAMKESGKFEGDGKSSSITVKEKSNDEIKPIKVNLNTDIQKQFDSATPKERKKIAEKYINDYLRNKDYMTTDSKTIIITATGAKKISHTNNEIKIRISPILGELIENGKHYGQLEVNHPKFDIFDYYDAEFSINNQVYRCRLNVGINIDRKMAQLYEVNLIKEK